MKYQTTRFGSLEVSQDDLLDFPEGMLGFDDLHRYFIVDPADETLILWLQSCDNPAVAFPILEPQVIKDDYRINLTKSELAALRLSQIVDARVFIILTIPQSLTEMTANLKAPVIVNPKEKLGKQCVLQQNEYPVKHPSFSALKAKIAMAKGGRSTFTTPGSVNTKKLEPTLPQEPMLSKSIDASGV